MEAPYTSDRPGASGQGAQWVFGTNKFTDEDHARIQEALNTALSWDQINSRPGCGGKKVHYLTGHTVIENANKIFGFAGWDSSILHLSVDYVEKTEDGKFWTAAATAIVRVALSNGSGHEDVGNAHLKDRDKGEVLERAKKSAVTDAMKRAMRLFGPHLGGDMSNKEGLKDVERTHKQNQRELKANLQKDARERAAQQQQQQQQQHQQQQQQQQRQQQQQQQQPPPRPPQQQPPPPRPQQHQQQQQQQQQQQRRRQQQQQQQRLEEAPRLGHNGTPPQQPPGPVQQRGAQMQNRLRPPQQQQQQSIRGGSNSSNSFVSPQQALSTAAAVSTAPPTAAAAAAVEMTAAAGATSGARAFSPCVRPLTSSEGAQGLRSASPAPPMPPGFVSGSGGSGGGVSTPIRPGQPAASSAAAIVSTPSAAPTRAGRGVLSESSPNQTNLGRSGGGSSGRGMPVFDAAGANDVACSGSIGGGGGGGNGGGLGGVPDALVQHYHGPPFDYAAAAAVAVGGSDASKACAAAPGQTICAAPRLEALASPPMALAIEAGAIGGSGGTDGGAAAMGEGGGRDEFDMSQDFESAFLEIDTAIHQHTISSLSGGSADLAACGGGSADSNLTGAGVGFGGSVRGVDCGGGGGGSGGGGGGGGGVAGHELGGQPNLQNSRVTGAGRKRLRALPQASR